MGKDDRLRKGSRPTKLYIAAFDFDAGARLIRVRASMKHFSISLDAGR
jgi:hypothetical protein